MSTYVVTGANRGLGLQFVKTLAAKPSNVVVGIYRSEGAAADLLSLASSSKNVHAVKGEIGNVASLRAAAEAISKVTDGKIDVLINNAAVMYPGKDQALPQWSGQEEGLEELLGDMLHTNTTAPILTTQVFLDLLRKGSRKTVVNLSTGMAVADFTLTTEFAAPGYAISKAALNMATVTQAIALKSEGFIVFALSPGLVNTATEAPSPEAIKGFQYMVSRFKVASPEWNGAPLTPEDSVDQCLNVIDNIKAEQSGLVLSHKGNTEWL